MRNLYGENGFTEKITDLDTKNILDWVRNNSRWWNQGMISDEGFSSSISWIIKHGIIVTGTYYAVKN